MLTPVMATLGLGKLVIDRDRQCVFVGNQATELTSIEVGLLWRALTHVYPDRRVSLYFHFCDLLSGTPTPIQCDELRWIHPAQLGDHHFVEGDLPVLPDLARDLIVMAG